MAVRCLLINGSSHGAVGNSQSLLTHFQSVAEKAKHDFEFRTLILNDSNNPDIVLQLLEWAEAFVFATGTYWDSWGWPLQKFLESATDTEGTEVWLGKPAAVIVTMHSVGGKSVLSRLQGVLNTYGAMIPPMSGIVVSAVGQIALSAADVLDDRMSSNESDLLDDLWRPDDLEIVAHNLFVAARQSAVKTKPSYRSWEVDERGFEQQWLNL